MDEKTAQTILLLELKGRKKKKEDPIRIAEAAKFFADTYQWSNEEIGEKFGVSDRMVSKFLSLLRLPPEVKQWIANKEIGIDVGAQLAESTLHNQTKIEVGNLIRGMLAHDARSVIRYATKHPDASLEEFKRRVLTSKGEKVEISMIVISLQENEFAELRKEANDRGISIHEMGERIIKDWLRKKE